MSELTAEQLEAIRRLLIDPVRDAVRQEIQLSHQQLSSVIERLDGRLVVVERSTTRLRAFRRKIVAIYGVVAIVVGLAWEILRDKVISRLGGR